MKRGLIFNIWNKESITNGDWVGTFWQPANDDKSPWIEIDLGKPQKISSVVIYEGGQNVKSFKLQYKSGEEWISFYNGTTVGTRKEIGIEPIEANS